MTEKDIEGFIDNILIIPDTNVLLYLYKCSFNTSLNIVKLLNKIKDKITVPHQVYSEYLTHKDEEQAKIDKKYDTFTKALKQNVSKIQTEVESSIEESRKYDFPNCDSLENNINHMIEQIQESIDIYQKSLDGEKGSKGNQIANVEKLLDYLVTQKKIRIEIPLPLILEYIKEGEFRFKYKMPPGYMDEAEKDKEWQKDKSKDNFQYRIRKYGDLFIWKEIIKIGENNPTKKIIFVTNDIKEDWWIIKGENKNGVKMRDELYKEFVAKTTNDTIEFLNLSDFYSLFSNHYKISDNKTQMELEMYNYANNYVLSKYKDKINEIAKERAIEIDFEDIDSNFANSNTPDYNINDVLIKNVNIKFDDETAYYEIIFSVNMSAEYTRTDDEGDITMLGKANINIEINTEVNRDIIDNTEDEIKINSSKYNIESIEDPYKDCLETEPDEQTEIIEILK